MDQRRTCRVDAPKTPDPPRLAAKMIEQGALRPGNWRKSSYSGGGGVGGGNCVEVAWTRDGWLAIRDGKAPKAGVLLFTRVQADSLMQGLKNNKFGQSS
ncbi:uncharacterized protein DUF397 [Saccharopolyspora spinosa]|uniref:Uncharacterized protein DUF397 n=2 Tax=Saccharopolyspora spinosa TaxID=60894 RepID=A0A2N3XWF3_SACSN|nr:uncharacterized protein DUF397 [Saccharopolyspora spinosa]